MVANPPQLPEVKWQMRKDGWPRFTPIKWTADTFELAVHEPNRP
jgi:hypothetical protein